MTCSDDDGVLWIACRKAGGITLASDTASAT